MTNNTSHQTIADQIVALERGALNRWGRGDPGGIFFKAKDALKALKEEGCTVLEKIDESEYVKFAWVVDPEGNKVELWQPPPGQ